jgi:hypothetical protein
MGDKMNDDFLYNILIYILFHWDRLYENLFYWDLRLEINNWIRIILSI